MKFTLVSNRAHRESLSNYFHSRELVSNCHRLTVQAPWCQQHLLPQLFCHFLADVTLSACAVTISYAIIMSQAGTESQAVTIPIYATMSNAVTLSHGSRCDNVT